MSDSVIRDRLWTVFEAAQPHLSNEVLDDLCRLDEEIGNIVVHLHSMANDLGCHAYAEEGGTSAVGTFSNPRAVGSLFFSIANSLEYITVLHDLKAGAESALYFRRAEAAEKSTKELRGVA